MRLDAATSRTTPPQVAVAAAAGCDGMSLVEMLLSLATISLVLGGAVLVSESLRAGTADHQTRETLMALRVALTAYHDHHGRWPRGSTESEAIRELATDPSTLSLIQSLRVNTDPRGRTRVFDGYGKPIRYIVRAEGDASYADFVSAGPDGKFGDLASDSPQVRNDAVDNIYGSDLEAPTP